MGHRFEFGADPVGRVYRDLGQFKRAIETYEQALAIAREIGDRRNEGVLLGRLGLAYRALGQIERAIEFHTQALVLVREAGDRKEEWGWLGGLGLDYLELGQFERAIEFYEQALTIAREIGAHQVEQFNLGYLGIAYRALAQTERAEKFFDQALIISRQIGDRRSESIWLYYLGLVYRDPKDVEQAIEFHKNALTIARELGDQRGESYYLMGLGQALLIIGKLSEAAQCCQESLELDVPETSYQAAMLLGIVLLHQHNAVAREIFPEAIARCRAMLDKTTGLYQPRYILAAALVGQAVCDLGWAEEKKRVELLAPGLTEYQRALGICTAAGVVRDALHD